MAITLTCECGKKLRVNEDKIGKRVKCPGCQAILSVPVPQAEDEPEPPRKAKQAPAPEPEDKPEPPRKAKSKPTPMDDSDEEEVKPAKKKKPAPVEDDEDEEGEKPSKGKKPAPIDDEDEEDEKPSKSKKPAPPSSSGKIFVILGVGLFLLIGGGVAVVAALWYFDALPFGSRPSNIAKGPKGPGSEDKTEKPEVIEPRAKITAELGKEGDARKVGNVLLSQDGKRIALSNSYYANGKSQIWDLSGEPKKLHEFEGAIVAMSPDGKTVVHVKKDGRFLLDTDTAKPIAPIGFNGFVFFQGNDVCWTVNLYDDFQKRKKVTAVSYAVADGKKGKELVFDNKGDRFARATEKGEVFFVSKTNVHVWDASTEKWTRQVALKPDAGETLLLDVPFAVSPDGKWLMANAGKATFDPAIFDLSTGTATKIPKTTFFPHNPAFIPNRDILMGSSSKGTKKYHAAAFDVKANAVAGAFGTVESIAALAVSGDGSTLAAGTLEGEVVIWDLKQLK